MNYDCQTKKDSEWLVMVYLAGDNNLSAFSLGFLQELERVQHNKEVRVVAAFDSTAPWPKGARYVEINRGQVHPHPCGKVDWPLHNDLTYPGHAVVSPDLCEKIKQPPLPTEPIAKEALARFLDWVTHCYTAKHYMLILFGHGVLVAGNTFLADDNPPSYIRLSEFTRILREKFGRQRLDILACDNCVMNGIETAVELYNHVDYMIGSQSLMLANGWPVVKVIEEVGKGHANKADARKIAENVLRVCARNVLDFALMERSSEQAIIDVSQFGKHDPLVTAVRGLSAKLQCGLRFKKGPHGPELYYPVVRDVVRLARLEAQAYWNETFVDLYDFAALLIERCNQFIDTINGMANSLTPFLPRYLTNYDMTVKDVVRPWPLIRILQDITHWCKKIIDCFRCDNIVPHAYYVCPQLQYSHGISIYFPWTWPERPITFYPTKKNPNDYILKTPLHEYESYRFANKHYGDWLRFLKAFFRATLRDVRRVEYDYKPDRHRYYDKREVVDKWEARAIEPQKSGSDTGEPDDCECPQIKNYPRRFYISPADCERRMDIYGLTKDDHAPPNKVSNCSGKVSYLGWNIRGFLAKAIGLPLVTGQAQADDFDCPKKK